MLRSPAGPGDMDLGVERGERHAHVGRMRGDAGFARAEDGVHAVEPGDRGAAAAGLALVAGRRGVVEVIAAGALQQVAAGRGHVAQLRRGAGEDRAGQQRIALGDQRVIGEVGIRHQRADAQAAVRRLLDGLERQPRNVDQPRRPLDVFFHQVDQVGAAGDEFRRWDRRRSGAPRRRRRLARAYWKLIMAAPWSDSWPAGSPPGCWDRRRNGRYCRSSARGSRRRSSPCLRRSGRRRSRSGRSVQ